MSVEETNFSSVRTRRALNDLQYSPNGCDVVGTSPRKSNKDSLYEKKSLFLKNTSTALTTKSATYNQINQKLDKKKKIGSISLPDICSTVNNISTKSVTSTPNKAKASSKLNNLGMKSTIFKSNSDLCSFQDKNISIIPEEKENQNLIYNGNNNSKLALKTSSIEVIKTERKEFNELSIQCCKSDEDLVAGENVSGTSYWKLMAHKRFSSYLETIKENNELQKTIDKLNKENDEIRVRNEKSMELIRKAEEIQKLITELEEDEEYNDDDSGYGPNS